MTTPGITHPTPAQGGGIETLGGIGGEFSGSRPVPGTRSSATTVAGVVLLLAAMALGAYAVMDPGDPGQSDAAAARRRQRDSRRDEARRSAH